MRTKTRILMLLAGALLLLQSCYRRESPTPDGWIPTEAQMDSISQMDDILPDVKSDDNKEYGSMENPMSLEDVREDEENEDDEDEEEDER